tara:strand:+ start:528 stop:2180 length:1653 start_codon:yes stop_codon:yes gene_type:complete
MAYDSLAGGFARGIQNAQRMHLMQEERKRLDEIAKLEGKLTEAKLKQLQNEQTAKSDLSAFLGGIRSDNQRADLQDQRPGQLVNPKQMTVDRMSTDPRNVSGMGMPPQKREEPGVLELLTRFPNLSSDMRDQLIQVGKLRRQEQMNKMFESFMPGGLSPTNQVTSGQNMIPGAQSVSQGGLASIPMAEDYEPTISLKSVRMSESGERPIPTFGKQEVGRVELMQDNNTGEFFNVHFSKRGQALFKTIPYETREVTLADGSKVLRTVRPGSEQAGDAARGSSGSPIDGSGGVGGTQTAPGVFDKPPPEGTTSFINAEGQTVPVDLERGSVNELNQAGYFKAPPKVIEAFRLADETLRNIEVLEGQWMALTQQGGAGGIATGRLGGLANRMGRKPVFNLNNPAFTKEQIDRGELESSTFKQTLNDRIDYITSNNPAMRLYFDNYLSTAVSLARAEGEVGALAEGDIARALKKLPFPGLQIDDRGDVRLFTLQRRDDPVTAAGKFDETKRKIRQKGLLNDWRNRFKNRQPTVAETENDRMMRMINEIEAEEDR